MDVYTSDDYGTQQKIACSYNDDATGCDFDSSDWEQVLRCNDSVSCPSGFAIMGRCLEDGEAAGSDSAGYCDTELEASCPYVCVPDGSTDADGVSCEPPSNDVKSQAESQGRKFTKWL